MGTDVTAVDGATPSKVNNTGVVLNDPRVNILEWGMTFLHNSRHPGSIKTPVKDDSSLLIQRALRNSTIDSSLKICLYYRVSVKLLFLVISGLHQTLL